MALSVLYNVDRGMMKYQNIFILNFLITYNFDSAEANIAKPYIFFGKLINRGI